MLEQGVSANLRRALGDLGGHRRDHHFEIGFAWARGFPGQEPAQEIAFADTMPAILAKAGDELAALARGRTAEITGEITDLHDRRGEPSRIKVVGFLQVHGEENFPRRSIWVVLSAPDYDRAIDAHRRERTVEVTGQLNSSGRRLELRATSFRVVS